MKDLSEIFLIPLSVFLFYALLEINHLKKEVRRLDENIFQERLDRIKERK